MTRKDLANYLYACNCEIEQLPDGRARVIMYKNPKTGTHAFLYSPVDETEVARYTVCAICTKLGIEVPPYGKPAIEVNNKIHGHIKSNSYKR